jgi:hypothetical protein
MNEWKEIWWIMLSLRGKIAGYEYYGNKAFKHVYLLISSTVLWQHLVPASLLLWMCFIFIAIMNSIEQRILISWANKEVSCPLCKLTACYHVRTAWKTAPTQFHPLHSTSTHPVYLVTYTVPSLPKIWISVTFHCLGHFKEIAQIQCSVLYDLIYKIFTVTSCWVPT